MCESSEQGNMFYTNDVKNFEQIELIPFIARMRML